MFDGLFDRLRAMMRLRRTLSVAFQLLLVIVANRLAFLLRFDGALPGWAQDAFLQTLPILLFCRAIAFVPFRLYQGVWRYTSVHDLTMLAGGITTSSVMFYVLLQTPLGPPVYPRSVLIMDAVLVTMLLGGVRLVRKVHGEFTRSGPGQRVLVFGAGDAGELIVRDMKYNPKYGYTPVGFVDDDPAKVARRIHGVPVLGTRNDLPEILERYRPHEVLLAMPNADPAAVRAIVRALEPFKVPIKTLPNLHDLINGQVDVAQIRSLEVADLLPRAAIGLDPAPVRNLIKGRRVMVTGAGGSIGSELCRQLVSLHPASLILFERYENTLHAVRLELEDRKPSCTLHPVIGDVGDMGCLTAALQKHQPEIVFHAAAHKHVPLMEENPCEAIKNNVRGTRLLAQAAEFYGVDRFILISTDKAVNPTSVMGASKRLAELALQVQGIGSGTSFSVVRFGNVLGSNGSVVPRFLEQIKKGGPVTITHPDMRRFFMLIPEAVQLVLHAAAQAESGATYVLEMGEQVRLLDMARDLIRLSGFIPEEDIPIEFIGLRPGEKLYEELVCLDEEVGPSRVDKVLRVTNRRRPFADLFVELEALETDAANGNTAGVLAALKRMIPEYANPALASAAGARLQSSPDTLPSTSTVVADDDGHTQACPQCAVGRVHRSKARSIIEKLKREITQERLYRCGQCGWRGWMLPLVYVEPTMSDGVAPPDLGSLDEVVGSSPSGPRTAFSPRNLY